MVKDRSGGLDSDAAQKREMERLKNISNQAKIVRTEMQKTYEYFQRLAEGVLTQIASLLVADCPGILVLRDVDSAAQHFSVLAASGCYRTYTGCSEVKLLAPELKDAIQRAFEQRQ